MLYRDKARKASLRRLSTRSSSLKVQHIFALLAKSAPVLRSFSGPCAVLMTDHMPASFATCSRVLPRDLMYEVALRVANADKDGEADDYDESAVQLASLALVNKAWHAVCSPLIWKVRIHFTKRGAPRPVQLANMLRR